MQLTLKTGFMVGDEKITSLTLRKLTTGDLLDCEAAAEQLKVTPQGLKLVPSPAVMTAELYRRAVLKMGELDGPLSIKQLKSLSLEDYELLIESYHLLNNPMVDEVAENSSEGR
ncbi:phage tail assembly protein [Orbaceae bacterium ESL0721]|nr:phage tail assembly protein [Orbaceae bacterium ESL0721]